MKKILILVLILIVLMFVFSVVSFAQYPEKEVEWICWSNPGGGSDMTARTVGIPLRKALKVPLIIINMSGGSGARAMNYTMSKPADGYTWQFVTGELVPTIERGLVNAEIEDFVPLVRLNFDPHIICVSGKSNVKSIEDLVVLGRERTIKWGLVDLGGSDHISTQIFSNATGIDYDPIVFHSGSEVLVGALGGVIDAFIANPSEVMGQYEAGKIIILTTLTQERLGILPEVPTMEESGYSVPDCGTWRGVCIKKGTDPEIISYLEKQFFEATKKDIYRDFLAKNGMDYNVLGAKDFKTFIDSYTETTKEIINQLGLGKK